MREIRHPWSVAKKKYSTRRAYGPLSHGDAFLVATDLPDDERRVHCSGSEPNMLTPSGDAFDASAADFRGWRGKAGVRPVEVRPLPGPASAGIAHL